MAKDKNRCRQKEDVTLRTKYLILGFNINSTGDLTDWLEKMKSYFGFPYHPNK